MEARFSAGRTTEATMIETLLTRRRFAGSLAAAAAAFLARPAAAAKSGTAGTQPAEAAPPAAKAPAAAPAAAGPRAIHLDSNENPYGPPPAALEAMLASRARAARYPDPLETPLTEDLARHHGVTPDNILLGCGSGEILKMADMAFLGAGRKVVAAEPTFEAVLHFAGLARAEAI